MRAKKRAGLTASFLSQVERDLTSPSIESLNKINQALQAPIFFFLLEPDGKCPVVREDKRVRLNTCNLGGRIAYR